MAKRTRQKQLAKLAERRAAERRRRRRNRAIAIGAVAVLVLGTGGAVAWTLIRDEPDTGDARAGNEETEPETVACGGDVPRAADERKRRFKRPPKLDLREGADYAATLVTSCGRIEVDLYEDQTPLTVNNFVFLAREGYYEGLTFHRVVRSPTLSVIQGGDPKGDGTGGPGYRFEDEILKSLSFNRPGLVAMANAGEDTNGSQFFITLDEPRHLNGAHTIFGEVTKGMRVAGDINNIPTGPEDVPQETVYIEKVIVRAS